MQHATGKTVMGNTSSLCVETTVDIPNGKQHSDDVVVDGRIKINIQMCYRCFQSHTIQSLMNLHYLATVSTSSVDHLQGIAYGN